MGGNQIPTGTKEVIIPTKSKLLTPTPNPLSGSFAIPFVLEKTEQLEFSLFDFNGKIILEISAKKIWNNGNHPINVNSTSLTQGSYLIKMMRENYVLTLKIIILK